MIDSPGREGSNGAVRMAIELADADPTGCPYQYRQRGQPEGRTIRTTGPRSWSARARLTHFVAGLGTSGTSDGCRDVLKEQNPDIKILGGRAPSGEQVEGLRSLEDG